MHEKKVMVILLIVLISTLIVSIRLFENSTHSQTLKDENLKIELTILEAVKLAYPFALKWDKDSQVLQAINIDLDKPGKLIGSNGKRKYWNILFGVPETNKEFLVTIHEGKIESTEDIGGKGSSPHPVAAFIKFGDINYDSPQLLKKALELGEVHQGKDWAKGYNFMMIKDPETKITLILVIGWDADQKKMVAVYFNATNGEHLVNPK
ncbi:hypothetical protein ACWV26_11445 [Rummeliibacillus sp. JY-2-4R]